MKPLGKRIFLTLEEPKQKENTQSNTLITSMEELKTVIVKATIGVVQKVGSSVTEGRFNIGDRVYLGEYYPDPQNIDGEMYIILDEDKIIAK